MLSSVTGRVAGLVRSLASYSLSTNNRNNFPNLKTAANKRKELHVQAYDSCYTTVTEVKAFWIASFN